jgi:putative ABC transport system permease protein
MEWLRSDLVAAIRELKTGPLAVTAAVMTLAAPIGMNVAMFSLVDRALLSPPKHIARPDRLFSVSFRAPGEPAGQAGMTTTSFVTYHQLRDGVPSLPGVAAWHPGPGSVVVDNEQTRADILLVSGNYFDVLGASPRIGRGMSAADEANGIASAVISDAFWHSAFHSDPEIVGRRIVADGVDYRISAVMPRGFSGHSAASVDVWLPLSVAMRSDPGWSENPFRNVVSIFARLADSSTMAVATEQAAAVLNRGVALRSVSGSTVGSTERKIAIWLSAVSLLVLAIGLANAATLLLVRSIKRRRESAIKSALGASRGRLLAEVAIQATVIATAGTAAALLLGQWLDEGLRRVLLPAISESARIEKRTLVAALVAGVVAAAVAFGAGAWALPSSARSADFQLTNQRGRVHVQTFLLWIQTTVCVLLLAGTGMFARSLYRLMQQDFGMQMDHVLVVEFERGGAGPDVDREAIFSEAVSRVSALPGVQETTTFQTLPFEAHHVPPISVPGKTEDPNIGGQRPYLIGATPEFFAVLGIAIVEGRIFTASDDRGEPVVIVNQTMAHGVWPGESAIGKCIRIGFDPSFDPLTASGPPTASADPCRRVVGVAKDVRQRSVVPTDNEAALMQYYVPPSQTPGPPAGMGAVPHANGLVVRTATDPTRLIDPIRRLVVNGRSTLPYVEVRPYPQSLERQVRPWRTGLTLLAMFSVLAIGVAAVGLYAAFAHAMTQRNREMAIRVAIGASPAAVMTMILAEASRLAIAGITAGMVGAMLAGRTLQSVLYGFVAADPMVLASAGVVMVSVIVAAIMIPAARASRVDPNLILRSE